VRSTKQPVIRGVGVTWVAMMRLVPVPWRQRVWALPWWTALCWPAKPRRPRRHQTRVDWVRQMMPHVRRGLPGPQLVLVVDGGCAAVSLALAGVKPQVTRVSRWRGDAARSHPPEPQPAGTRGPNPTQGKRQRRVQGWAARSETPWEDVEGDGSGGQRQTRGVFSRTGLWDTPRVPPVAIRDGVVADPAGQLRLAACCWTALHATPVPIRRWVVRRWAVEVTCAEARAPLGVATQRQWSEPASARTTPVRLALVSLVTVWALRWCPGGQIPVPVTAWYHKAEPPCSDGLTLVRRPLWRAPYVVHSTPEAESMPWPQGVLDRLLHGLPRAA
jgi:hypothetical protein